MHNMNGKNKFVGLKHSHAISLNSINL